LLVAKITSFNSRRTFIQAQNLQLKERFEETAQLVTF